MSEQQLRDIAIDIIDRMGGLENQIQQLMLEKAKIDAKIQAAVERLKALRLLLEAEKERLGQPSLPEFTGTGQPSKFAGLRLKDALLLLRQEDPSLTKQEAKQILLKENFDFRGKNPGLAVHMAWVGIEKQSRATQP